MRPLSGCTVTRGQDKAVSPVIYLDFDGVINFFGGRHKHRERSGLGYTRHAAASPLPRYNQFGQQHPTGVYPIQWSGQLLHMLSEIDGLDIIWLTTWRDSTSELERAMGWMKPVGSLDWVDGPTGREHAGKVPALLHHQMFTPRPFIWADDEAHQFYLPEHRAQTANTPQLLIAPDEKVGLTASHVQQIADFVAEHRA